MEKEKGREQGKKAVEEGKVVDARDAKAVSKCLGLRH
jgi:hypothetical protein